MDELDNNSCADEEGKTESLGVLELVFLVEVISGAGYSHDKKYCLYNIEINWR